MLIEPEVYIETLKSYNVEGLIKERNKIIRKIQFYEDNKHNRDAFDFYPTPE